MELGPQLFFRMAPSHSPIKAATRVLASRVLPRHLHLNASTLNLDGTMMINFDQRTGIHGVLQ